MAAVSDRFSVNFPADYDARGEQETPLKGYLGDVIVCLEDGSRYSLFFYDPVRLAQDLKSMVECGKACLAEPNMIVLPELTTEAIRKAVEQLVGEGFFRLLKPL